MTQGDLDIILAKVPQRPDGSIRCIASRFLKGKPLDRSRSACATATRTTSSATRPPRAVRYKVFAAWLAHNDCREINSLDMYVNEEDRHFVPPFIDWATLGSGSTGPNLSEGYEYQFDVGQMVKSFASFGPSSARGWTPSGCSASDRSRSTSIPNIEAELSAAAVREHDGARRFLGGEARRALRRRAVARRRRDRRIQRPPLHGIHGADAGARRDRTVRYWFRASTRSTSSTSCARRRR